MDWHAALIAAHRRRAPAAGGLERHYQHTHPTHGKRMHCLGLSAAAAAAAGEGTARLPTVTMAAASAAIAILLTMVMTSLLFCTSFRGAYRR
jgi:hypothetical protein